MKFPRQPSRPVVCTRKGAEVKPCLAHSMICNCWVQIEIQISCFPGEMISLASPSFSWAIFSPPFVFLLVCPDACIDVLSRWHLSGMLRRWSSAASVNEWLVIPYCYFPSKNVIFYFPLVLFSRLSTLLSYWVLFALTCHRPIVQETVITILYERDKQGEPVITILYRLIWSWQPLSAPIEEILKVGLVREYQAVWLEIGI